MKQMYIKPIVEQAEMLPQNVICTSTIVDNSGTGGGSSSSDPIPVD